MNFNGVFVFYDAFGKAEGVRKQTVKNTETYMGSVQNCGTSFFMGFTLHPVFWE